MTTRNKSHLYAASACTLGGWGECFIPFLLSPGSSRRVQSRSEGIDLDFIKVTERSHVPTGVTQFKEIGVILGSRLF